VLIFTGPANMPRRIDPASSDLSHQKEGIVDFSGDDTVESDADRLPLQLAVPIVIALNLSLWLGIGLAIRALL
jgi:hypothetical protein